MDKQRRPCTLDEAKQEFRENIKKLGSSFVTYFFILDTKGAVLRKKIIQFSLFSIWAIFSLILLYGTGFATLLGKSFQYLLTFPPPAENPFIELTNLIIVKIGPMSTYFFIIVLAPLLLAYRAAIKYLADIYELNDEEIAAKFIWQAAFASQYDSISIVEGEIAEKDKNSPIVRIGGPGVINVDLCSAVLFEKPNGRPHVIGPVYKPPPKKLKGSEKLLSDFKKKMPKPKNPSSGANALEGFERFRYAKNLHDEALLPIEIKSRTRDGIPVVAKDVRLVYSIWRGEPSEEEKKAIYSYRKEAIPSFFYDASCTVSDIIKGGCTISPVDPMQGIVSAALSSFISQHSLSEFLTSVGEPEKKSLKKRAQKYQNEKDQLDKTSSPPVDFSDEKFSVPDFSPRHEANPLFTEFAEEFSIKNRKKGVTLQWLGTGIWIVPEDILDKNQKEHYELDKKNHKDGSEKNFEKTEVKERNNELLRLVRKTPLGSAMIISAPNSYRENIIREMLSDYIGLIKNAINFLDSHTKKSATHQKKFWTAIRKISRLLTNGETKTPEQPNVISQENKKKVIATSTEKLGDEDKTHFHITIPVDMDVLESPETLTEPLNKKHIEQLKEFNNIFNENCESDNLNSTKEPEYENFDVVIPAFEIFGEATAGSEGGALAKKGEAVAFKRSIQQNFDEGIYKIHFIDKSQKNIRRIGNKIYGWFKVKGESMNNLIPTPIEPGDYVLFEKIQSSDLLKNKIIIASETIALDLEPTIMVKLLWQSPEKDHWLISASKDKELNKLIKLTSLMTIEGRVVAIAKPKN